MKIHFNALFTVQGHVLMPLQTIRIQGLAFGAGVSLWKGFCYGGIRFADLEGQYLEVEADADGYWLLSVYQEEVFQPCLALEPAVSQ